MQKIEVAVIGAGRCGGIRAEVLDKHLCRCGANTRRVRAVQRAATPA